MGIAAIFIDGGYIDKVMYCCFNNARPDYMVGVDMALLAGKGKITNISLLSGDSGLIPAVDAVKREGVLVTLWHGPLDNPQGKPSRELFEVCDDRRELNQDLVEKLCR